MAELLVEIGFEEMPASWLPGLAEQLQRALRRGGRAASSSRRRTCAVLYTPRRLVLRADVPARQPDREEPVWGPALKVAKDAAGKWTGAAQGFAKKNGVAVDELREGAKDPAKPGELYLLFVRKVAGRPDAPRWCRAARGAAARARLPEAHELGRLARGRPRRLPVRPADPLAGPAARRRGGAVRDPRARGRGARAAVVVESGRATPRPPLPAARAGAASRSSVRSFAELRDRLREHFVLVDPGRARGAHRRRAAGGAGDASFDDHGLRDEWRDLVEYPTVLVGRGPGRVPRAARRGARDRARAPPEVHLAARRRRGGSRASPPSSTATAPPRPRSCAAWSASSSRACATPRSSSARTASGTLAERVDDLAGVTFHQGLGSYRDKAERLEKLVARDGPAGPARRGRRCAAAARGARLAKADLVTLMVREFTELQGVMGGIYLAAEGAPDEVATAVRWHYHPVAVEADAEPAAAFAGRDAAARVFAAVALADKLDTLAGYFGLGESPTGSRDPFGLRRAGQGAVRAALDFWRPAGGRARARPAGAAGRGGRRAIGALKQPPTRPSRAADAVPARPARVRARRARVLRATRCRRSLDAPAEGAGEAAVRALQDPIDALRRLEALQRVRREVAGGLRGAGRGLQAREEHPRAGEAGRRRRRGAVRVRRGARAARRRVEPRARPRARTRSGCAGSRPCAPRSAASSTTCS